MRAHRNNSRQRRAFLYFNCYPSTFCLSMPFQQIYNQKGGNVLRPKFSLQLGFYLLGKFSASVQEWYKWLPDLRSVIAQPSAISLSPCNRRLIFSCHTPTCCTTTYHTLWHIDGSLSVAKPWCLFAWLLRL